MLDMDATPTEGVLRALAAELKLGLVPVGYDVPIVSGQVYGSGRVQPPPQLGAFFLDKVWPDKTSDLFGDNPQTLDTSGRQALELTIGDRRICDGQVDGYIAAQYLPSTHLAWTRVNAAERPDGYRKLSGLLVGDSGEAVQAAISGVPVGTLASLNVAANTRAKLQGWHTVDLRTGRPAVDRSNELARRVRALLGELYFAGLYVESSTTVEVRLPARVAFDAVAWRDAGSTGNLSIRLGSTEVAPEGIASIPGVPAVGNALDLAGLELAEGETITVRQTSAALMRFVFAGRIYR